MSYKHHTARPLLFFRIILLVISRIFYLRYRREKETRVGVPDGQHPRTAAITTRSARIEPKKERQQQQIRRRESR